MSGEHEYQRGDRRAIPCHCSVHGGTPGFSNLLVCWVDGQIVLLPHASDACVITLDEAAANQLFDALGEWLG